MLDLKLVDGRWRGLLERIGVPHKVLNGHNQPCPFCGGVDRFRFIDKNGWGTWVCNRCQPSVSNGLEFVRRWLDCSMADAAKEIAAVYPDVKKEPPKKSVDGLSRTKAKWAAAVPVTRGDPVSLYLHRRGIVYTPRPEAVRYSAAERYFHNGVATATLPAMLALITDQSGSPRAIHATYLTPDGQKAAVESPRKVLSSPGEGPVAVRLFAPVDGHIGIAEGLETAMAAEQLYGLPTWSVISAGGMERWYPPTGCRAVTVFADNDSSFTGQKAAYLLAFNLRQRGVAVNVRVPPRADTDFADLL